MVKNFGKWNSKQYSIKLLMMTKTTFNENKWKHTSFPLIEKLISFIQDSIKCDEYYSNLLSTISQLEFGKQLREMK